MNHIVHKLGIVSAAGILVCLTAIASASPQPPDSRPATRPAASRPAKGVKRLSPEQLAQLRSDVEEYRQLNKTLQNSWSKQVELEQQLDEMKRRLTPGNQLFRQGDLEKVQAELHTLTDDLVKRNKRRRELAENILSQSPEWRASLNKRLDALNRELKKNPDATPSADQEKERDEISRRLATLDTIANDSRAFGPMFGRLHGRGGPPVDGRMDGRMHGPGGGPNELGPKGPMGQMARFGQMPGNFPLNTEQQIERLEREQAMLKQALAQNEAMLKRLRDQQTLKQDSSEPGTTEMPESAPETRPANQERPLAPVLPRLGLRRARQPGMEQEE